MTQAEIDLGTAHNSRKTFFCKLIFTENRYFQKYRTGRHFKSRREFYTQFGPLNYF